MIGGREEKERVSADAIGLTAGILDVEHLMIDLESERLTTDKGVGHASFGKFFIFFESITSTFGLTVFIPCDFDFDLDRQYNLHVATLYIRIVEKCMCPNVTKTLQQAFYQWSPVNVKPCAEMRKGASKRKELAKQKQMHDIFVQKIIQTIITRR
ncbi:MAG TPA: hypothetical protein DCE42_06560 [Myxococcales bacterium]|nr:hypothetical protein [Deltaproteobacteria bacterium]HAA54398.1 hypothetical protein [Myxococcales bacterium]|tara:strand:+ start:11410 stop:11874 length:465 start_codon:yes stop_codon:yes gene_type:complete